MLSHPTLETLHDLGLHGCAAGFNALEADTAAAALSHGEWLAVMLEHELTYRRQKRFAARAARAKLRHAATIEEVTREDLNPRHRTIPCSAASHAACSAANLPRLRALAVGGPRRRQTPQARSTPQRSAIP